MKTISLRIEKEIERKLEFLMKAKHIEDRSSYLRSLLDSAMANDIIEYAIEEFKKRRMSLWKAASIVDLSLREFMDIIRSKDILTIDPITIHEDIKRVRESQ